MAPRNEDDSIDFERYPLLAVGLATCITTRSYLTIHYSQVLGVGTTSIGE